MEQSRPKLTTTVYSCEIDNITPTPPFPNICNFTLHKFEVGNKDFFIFFGGANQMKDVPKAVFSNKTFLYHLESKKWKEIPVFGTVPLPRAGHRSAFFLKSDEYIYNFFHSQKQLLSSVLIWAQDKVHRLIVFGGANSTSASNDLYMLKTGGFDQQWEWKKIEHTTESVPTPRHGHSFSLVGTDFLLYGGTQNGDKYSHNLYSWTFSSEGAFSLFTNSHTNIFF